MKEIKIKVGDTVIYKDGMKGKIIKAKPTNKFSNPLIIAEVSCENGRNYLISKEQEEINFQDFYLIGTTVFGNKLTEEELEKRIENCDKKIEELKQWKKQFRKQLWRLKEEMVEDWRERKALRELRKRNKENQSTEEDTED